MISPLETIIYITSKHHCIFFVPPHLGVGDRGGFVGPDASDGTRKMPNESCKNMFKNIGKQHITQI